MAFTSAENIGRQPLDPVELLLVHFGLPPAHITDAATTKGDRRPSTRSSELRVAPVLPSVASIIEVNYGASVFASLATAGPGKLGVDAGRWHTHSDQGLADRRNLSPRQVFADCCS